MLNRFVKFSFMTIMSTAMRPMASTKNTLPQTKSTSTKPQTKNNLPQKPQVLRPQHLDQVMKEKAIKKRKYYEPFTIKLPQTQNLEEIFKYYNTYSSRFSDAHYQIVFSRLAHLKSEKINTAHPTISKMINGLCRFQLYKHPSILSSLIKYSSIIGIRDRTLWTKFVRSLRHSDFKKRPMDIALTVQFMSKAGIRGESLWRDLQMVAEEAIKEKSPGYECIQMLLEGFMKGELEESFKQKLVSRIKQQISFVELDAIKKLVSYSEKYAFDDAELWGLLKKWTVYRLDKPKKDDSFVSQDQFPYMIYCYGKAAEKGLLAKDSNDTQTFFSELSKHYKNVQELLESDPANANTMLAYYGFIAGFSSCGVIEQDIQQGFNDYVARAKSVLTVKDYGLLIQLLGIESRVPYFREETVRMIQAYVVANVPHFTIEQYYSILTTAEKVELFDQEALYSVLKSSVDFFIQTNAQHPLTSEILAIFEAKGVLSQESVQEKKILFNLH